MVATGQIVLHALSRDDLTTGCETHMQGKKRSMEAHALEYGSGEMAVVHAEGFNSGMVVALGIGSSRKVAVCICIAGMGVKVTGRDEHSDKHLFKNIQ